MERQWNKSKTQLGLSVQTAVVVPVIAAPTGCALKITSERNPDMSDFSPSLKTYNTL